MAYFFIREIYVSTLISFVSFNRDNRILELDYGFFFHKECQELFLDKSFIGP